jgi:phage N-6-adenine-methyltransferase
MKLLQYDRARQALQKAHSLDEVKEIADKTQAMRHYAKQAKDPEMEIWLAEIRLRALRRLGELSKKLKKAPSGRAAVSLPDAGKSKAEVLAAVGLSTSQAHRCEQIADIAEPDFERYIAIKSEREEPVTVDEVVGAVVHGRGTIATKWNRDAESFTPPEYVEAARQVMGKIDLDPASCAQAQKIIQAKRYYDEGTDGLNSPWRGCVFLNPPYRQPDIMLFVDRLCAHIEARTVSQAILLTNNNTDTAWWHQAAKMAAAVCFTQGRISFIKDGGLRTQPTNGQTFFYFGKRVARFRNQFSAFGFLMERLR